MAAVATQPTLCCDWEAAAAESAQEAEAEGGRCFAAEALEPKEAD